MTDCAQHVLARLTIEQQIGQLMFVGLAAIVSDDLGSAAAVASIPPGDRAVNFIASGGDLVTVKTADLIAPIAAAVANRMAGHRIFANQVHAAASRVLLLKIRAGLVKYTTS
ncbi:MAG: hypothetical protein ACYDA0_11255 [Candidatus Dormibacteraceae bacterium]